MTLQIVLAIAGSIALLIGLFGGGVKAKEIEVPKITMWSRIFSSLVGMVLIGISVRLPNPSQSVESPTTTPVPTAESTRTSEPIATLTSQPVKTDTPSLPTETAIPATPTPGIGSIMPGKDGMILLYVPAGEFTMGSENSEEDEKPVHTVYLDAYWIDRTEVTNKMYALCVQADVCNEPKNKISYTHSSYYGNGDYDNYPVIYVDWTMAKTYCEWVDRRLPTEAEWEKAGRGESAFVYPWGDHFDGTKVSFCDKNCPYDWADKSSDDGFADIAPVGSYPKGASLYGALDMAGNVWEWVSDWYDVYPGGDPNASSDFGQKYRVLRGGTWKNDSGNVRVDNRWLAVPMYSDNDFGFRCAMDASPF